MKRISALLAALVLSASFAICTFATEPSDTVTEPQTTTCEHSWNEGSAVSPTCTEAGEVTSVCTLCNETKTTSIPATGHSFDSVKKGDASAHIAVCGTCGAEESRSHNWGEGTVTKEADCVNTGEKSFACSCGETKTETVAALGHDLSAWEKTEKNHSRACSRCDHSEIGGHIMASEVTKEATCKETGTLTKTCSVCGFTVNEVIAKLSGHTYDNACDSSCNSCGETRDTKHDYGNSWSRDYSGHWHECTKCGEKTDFKKHYPGSAATEEDPQICLTCDYVLVERLPHKHDTEKIWTSDETGHWHSCRTCSEKLDFKDHTYDDICDEICNICDYKNESAHDLKEDWQTTDKKHWKECTVCGGKMEESDHVPGPEASEENAQLCTVCDYELAARKEHVHDFGDIWLYDGINHWKECRCGEKSVPAAHNWDDGTKGKGGSVYYQCADCHTHKVEEGSGFPWWILILLLLLLAGGGAAAYFLFLAPAKTEGSFLDDLSENLASEEEELPDPDIIPGEPALETLESDPEFDVESILKEFSDF